MTEFDPSKPVMTREGRPVRLFALDIKDSDWPIVGAVTRADGGESVVQWNSKGWRHCDAPGPGDLVNIPESKWINLYEDPESARIASIWHSNRCDADCSALVNYEARGGKRVALVEWKPSGEFITTAVEK